MIRQRAGFVLSVLGAWPLVAGCVPGSDELPNLILISIDTLRADHLSAYGYERATSPSIDALAEESVVFEKAFSQSPKTASSHMTIMTGLYPEAHGLVNWDEAHNRLGAGVPTLAGLLRDAGYRTEAYTWGGNVRAELGFDRGFDVYEHAREAVFDRAGEALEEFAAASGPPFFLFLHTYEVHDPYAPPAEYAGRFLDPEYSGRIPSSEEELGAAIGGGGSWWQRHLVYWGHVDRNSDEDVTRLRDLYDAAIAFVDQQIGDFLGLLGPLGLESNTVVVLLSDHGEEFFEHRGFLHDNLFQEVLHVPLMIRFPGGSGPLAPRRVEEVVRLVDLAPTILEHLQLPIPAHVQGASLLPVLKGEDTSSRAVFSQWGALGMKSMRVGNWKVVYYPQSRFLFDLSQDPFEQRNLAKRHPGQERGLHDSLEQILAESRTLRESLGPAPSPPELSDEVRKELKALGYLNSDD
jgi:arylsulfatase A-like enzyme